ncbi:MAG: hypothetical protein RL434_786 [Pseudomonadota bacterium]|jgi:sulfide:quinone oxidoreductase
MSELTLTQHDADFATSPQLQPEDLAAVAKAGFRSVINNRPDGEGGDTQPLSKDIEAAARKVGLEYAYLPVVPTEINEHHVARYAELLASLPKPILGFCYTGGRATKLFKLATGA